MSFETQAVPQVVSRVCLTQYSSGAGCGYKITPTVPAADAQRDLLWDPQTSGGLLVSVTAQGEAEFLQISESFGLIPAPLDHLIERGQFFGEVQ